MKKATRGLLKLPEIFYKSLTNFKYYRVLDKLPRSRAVVYVVVLSLLLSIIAVIPSAILINRSMDEFHGTYETNAPDFTIENGTMTLAEPGPSYMINDSGKGFVVVFDDSDSLTELNFREYESVLLLDSDSVYLRSPVGTQEFPYEILFPEGMDKARFSSYMDLIKLTNLVFIALYIVTFILLNFLGIFFIAMIGNIFMTTRRYPLGFKRSFSLACYASTLPILFKTVNHVFALNIIMADIIFVLLGLLYFINAGNIIRKSEEPVNTDVTIP